MITYYLGERETRPWGKWIVLDIGPAYIVKRIEVMPHQQLSLQLHHHRSEHWIVISGSAEITIGERVFNAPNGTHAFIPLETKHRIVNKTDTSLIFIEIQIGDLLDENDIVRFQDVYGRI